MNYPVVTLCGSTRFKDYFMEVQRELTLDGFIVISVGCFGHAGDQFTDEQKVMLDDMHKRKIDMADAIFVINVDGYIGQSTRSEIEYAKKHGKKIFYLEEITKPANDLISRKELLNKIRFAVIGDKIIGYVTAKDVVSMKGINKNG